MKKTSVLLLFSAAFMLHAENRVVNPGFEAPLNQGWHTGSYGNGKGEVKTDTNAPYAGQQSILLRRTEGGGGTQLLSRHISLRGLDAIQTAFAYRGKGSVSIDFYCRQNGKTVRVKNAVGQPAGQYFSLKARQEWTRFSWQYTLPNAWQQLEELTAVFHFCVYPGQELRIDDVSLQGSAPSSAPAATQKVARITVHLPQTLSAKEAAGYHTPSGMKASFRFQDGVILRDGKPYFWIGDGGAIGGAQSGVAEAWLGRILKCSFASMDGAGRAAPGRRNETELEIGFSDDAGASIASLIRELYRNGIYSEIMTSDAIIYSPLKNLIPRYPGLEKSIVNGNHFFGPDSMDANGRKMREGFKAVMLRYLRDIPFFGLEDYRELGYSPIHERVVVAFREFAKQKYGTVEQASTVWRRPYSSWDRVVPPHLDRSSLISSSQRAQLRTAMQQNYPEMYYDWLAFCQQDLKRILEIEKTDYRKWTQAGLFHDMRAHQDYSDKYMTSDPEQLDPMYDAFFLHRGFTAWDTGGKPIPTDALNQSMTEHFTFNFIRNISSKPILNPECIVSATANPRALTDMAASDLAQLSGNWKFLPEGKTSQEVALTPGGDLSQWSEMAVPGCWDQTAQHAAVRGKVWYCKEFTLPAELVHDYRDGSKKFFLVGKGIAQTGTIWLNGVPVGHVSGWDTEYRFDVGNALKYGGVNRIAIQVDGKTGYHNGLRFYVHLLSSDQFFKQRIFGEKEYTALLWSYMMHGLSGVALWNWNGLFRPFMPRLSDEINQVSEFVIPDARSKESRVAYLYSYMRGLPFPEEKKYTGHMEWYKALLFFGVTPEVMGEATLQKKLSTTRYDLLLAPYNVIVEKPTYQKIMDFVRQGGTAAITTDSLQKNFTDYRQTDLEKIAGPRTTGADGSRTISIGKGKLIFLAPGLDMFAIHKRLRPALPAPEINVTCTADSGEFPYIERKLCGDGQRKVLYLHNWGGTEQALRLSLPQALRNHRMRAIRGDFQICSPDDIRISLKGFSPAALLLEHPDSAPLPIKRPAPERTEILSRMAELNRDSDGGKGRILFLPDLTREVRPVGRLLYPDLCHALRQLDFGTRTLPMEQWKPENLAPYRMVFLSEGLSNPFNTLGKQRQAMMKNVLQYVHNGGSLLLVSYTGATTNAAYRMLNDIAPALKIRISWPLARDPASCGFGDPLQLASTTFGAHPIAAGIKRAQFYPLRTMTAIPGSPMKPVAMTNQTETKTPGAAIIMAGTYGKGRIVIANDLLWLQPFRLELADNTKLLLNTLSWLLREPLPPDFEERFKRNRFITSARLDEIENLENNR